MSHMGERLSAFVDGELDHSDRDRVLNHLADCESCRFEAEMLRQLKRRLYGMDAPAPSMNFVARLSGLPGPSAPPDSPAGSAGGGAAASGLGSGPGLGAGNPMGSWPRSAEPGITPQPPPRPGSSEGPTLFRRLRSAKLQRRTRHGLAGACVAALALGTAFISDTGSNADRGPSRPAAEAQQSPLLIQDPALQLDRTAVSAVAPRLGTSSTTQP